MAARAREPSGLSLDECRGLLKQMIEIRAFENRIEGLFSRDLIRASTHLCNGQEAVVVGTCSALAPGDTMLCTYRGHGAILAMGAPLDRAFGEMLGRSGGLCKGKGGGMHLTDVTVGALGSFAIVGAHLPISAGIGLASKLRGDDDVNVCFFGDGAVNIGAFHEALNLASLWQLPILFICENNLYGEYSPLASTTPIEQLAERGAAYGIASERIDGNDVLEVRASVGQAVARARAGEGPVFIEALTYRHKGHSRTDPATYRPDGELEAWLERDPITKLEAHLLAGEIAEDDLRLVRDEAEQAVDDALERALSWPEPDPRERAEDVWA